MMACPIDLDGPGGYVCWTWDRNHGRFFRFSRDERDISISAQLLRMLLRMLLRWRVGSRPYRRSTMGTIPEEHWP